MLSSSSCSRHLNLPANESCNWSPSSSTSMASKVHNCLACQSSASQAIQGCEAKPRRISSTRLPFPSLRNMCKTCSLLSKSRKRSSLAAASSLGMSLGRLARITPGRRNSGGWCQTQKHGPPCKILEVDYIRKRYSFPSRVIRESEIVGLGQWEARAKGFGRFLFYPACDSH